MSQESALESRIAALEAGAKFEATKEAVQAVEIEFLAKFREIKSAMEATNGGSSNTKEIELLKKENEELKKKNAKLEYRIEHILQHFEKVYDKTSKS